MAPVGTSFPIHFAQLAVEGEANARAARKSSNTLKVSWKLLLRSRGLLSLLLLLFGVVVANWRSPATRCHLTKSVTGSR
eukprot:6463312-Amphidinium_carterae.1